NIAVQIKNAYGNWAKGIAVLTSERAHVQINYGIHNTIRDSYFYLTQNAAMQSYGYDCLGAGGDNLVVNNIFHAIEGAIKENGCIGDVIGYNYSVNHFYNTNGAFWSQPCISEHTSGTGFNLYEGTICSHVEFDVFHGPHYFSTVFRNWFR